MENLSYLNGLIDRLVKERLYLPAFILKAQIIEYDLKRFLWQYCNQYKMKPNFVTIKFLDEATLGQLHHKLSELRDNTINLDVLADEVKRFKKIRNNLVHEIVSSKLTIKQINIQARKGLKDADNLLQETWGRLEWIHDFFAG